MKTKYLLFFFTLFIPSFFLGQVKILTEPTSKGKNIAIKHINSHSEKRSYVPHSVLNSGHWIKLRIEKDGVYRLGFVDLINLGFSEPQDIAIFGSGGKMLPQNSNGTFFDDLPEIAVWINNNAVYFYAEGPLKWRYDSLNQQFVHEVHRFSTASFYFITDGSGEKKRIAAENPSTGNSNVDVNFFNNYQYHESETVNLLKSGAEWYGEEFNEETFRRFQFIMDDIDTDAWLKLSVNVLARAENESSFSLLSSGDTLQKLTMLPVNLYNPSTPYASVNSLNTSFPATSDTINIDITYNKPHGESTATGWLDYIRINARCHLRFNGSQMKFRDIESVGISNIAKYHICNAGNSAFVWNITAPENITLVLTQLNSDELSFASGSDSLKEFIIFDTANCYIPETAGVVINQDIHGTATPDLVIVTHPDFILQADLLAGTRRTSDKLDVLVITPEMVYNEFSSGSPDVTAIRNMMKMFNDRSSGSTKMYLLLLGDGSYDNKSVSSINTNFILTYQSDNSLVPVESFVTDDYFGLLDDGESLTDGFLDIGIGRIPVKTPEEAQDVVNKIIQYYIPSGFGSWRNRISFIADDGNDNIHMIQAESMAELVDTTFPSMNISKIFLDAFPQEDGPSGQRSQMTTEAIHNTLERGTLIFNYTGHGSETGLTAEQIITFSDILSWKNAGKLPLFMTATCEFSRFDNFMEVSGGELVLLNPAGGGIGLFTTTRLAYSTPNFILNKLFYNYIFSDTADNQRIGDVLRLTKNNAGTTINKLNFTLLGDPSLKLARPELNVITDTINSQPVTTFTDTISQSEKVIVSGYIADHSGNITKSFSGIIYPEVYDKSETISTLGSEGSSVMNFKLQDKVLFKGKASVHNGRFTFSFIAPHDMNPDIGYGKISYYAHNISDGNALKLTDAGGSYNRLLTGGISAGQDNDLKGPDIHIYIDNENFVNGGITTPDPKLIVVFSDVSGINTAGAGIGHDITMMLDENSTDMIILNDFYESELDNYQKGRIEYSLEGLKEGSHIVRLKAWDNCNNPGEAFTGFIVAESKELFIEQLFNYPNPTSGNTVFYFKHNLDGELFDVLIQVYSITGSLIKSISSQSIAEKDKLTGINWDCRDDYGNKICSGLFFYKCIINASGGYCVEKTGKLVLIK